MPTSESAGTFVPGDVVRAPFPYTDRSTRQRHPALIVSHRALPREHGLSRVVMIASAANRGWEADAEILDLAAAGLPAPSVIRTAKIATIDSRDAERLGRIAPDPLANLRRQHGAILGHE